MLTEKTLEKIKQIQKNYHSKKSAVMGALMAVQRDSGNNLTREDMDAVAKILDVNPVEIHAVAGFYTMYNWKKPVGRHHIQVCWNLSCSLLGAEHLISHMEKTLGITLGETTPDSMFTLTTAECLGSCGTAPMMQIGDDYYEDLTVEKVDKILADLRARS